MFGLLPAANEVCEGYVFTRVCQSFYSQGGMHAQGMCMPGGMHAQMGGMHAWGHVWLGHAYGGHACWAGHPCPAGCAWLGGVHAWGYEYGGPVCPGGVHAQGVCMPRGSMRAMHTPHWSDTTRYGRSMMQGLSVPFACVGSGDPVRVLRLYTMNTLDVFWSIYCQGICTTCRYRF